MLFLSIFYVIVYFLKYIEVIIVGRSIVVCVIFLLMICFNGFK